MRSSRASCTPSITLIRALSPHHQPVLTHPTTTCHFPNPLQHLSVSTPKPSNMGQAPSSRVSSPLSPVSPAMLYPTFHMTEDIIMGALEYVSQRLIKKGIHVHLIVAGDALSCLLFKSRSTTHTIDILQASTLSPRSLTVLSKAVQKAEAKFGLGANWVNTHLEHEIDSDYVDYVVHRSLLQNEVIFSSEGLTLVAIDLCFALKSKLEALSTLGQTRDLDDAVVILRRLVRVYRGRPLTKGYIGRSYPRMEASDQTLLRLNAEYEWQFGTRGIAGVNDEYMEWRREGVVGWNIVLEDLKREALGTEKGFYAFDKPLPEVPFEEFTTFF